MFTIVNLVKPIYIKDGNPSFYAKGDEVRVNAVKLFKDFSIEHCKPEKLEYKKESLSEFLAGDRLVNTNFEIKVEEDAKCKVLCPERTFGKDEIDQIRHFIKGSYRAMLVADNLLGVQRKTGDKFGSFQIGYPLGSPLTHDNNQRLIVTNHLKFNFKYNKLKSTSPRNQGSNLQIVDFTIEPMSVVGVEIEDDKCTMPFTSDKLEIWDKDKSVNTSFTYEVSWESSDLSWSERWNNYVRSYTEQVHSFSVVNSFMIVGFVAAALGFFLCRMVNRDIYQYNAQVDDDVIEESGWKLTHGDVFRPPQARLALCVLVGSGTQLLMSLTGVAVLAFIGQVSPAMRGSLMTAGLVLYVFGGILAGYWVGRLYRSVDQNFHPTRAIFNLYPS
ncbi:hypothetical protein ACOME3_006490 [Neoechinorhynchus agilis]